MRVLAEIAAWGAVGFVVWMATVQTVTASELIVAGAGALVCAIPAPWLRRANDGVWKPRWAWLGWPMLVLRQLPGDIWRVWRFAFARSEATDPWVQLELPKAAKAVAATRRAVGLMVLSATPSTVVVDSDPEQNTLLVHRVGDGSDRLESAVKR
ncbi:MAG TPA: hypothetical protein VH496_21960 [Mycobacterium sp.]|jgi:multisubunit Na+/H+ antiporter MnhE subunit